MKKQELLNLWERYSKLVESNQEQENIEEENKLIDQLERNLPFKNQEEHEKWLDIMATYKFWEDFEELTLEIINRKGKPQQMKFKYKNKWFQLMELKEIGTSSTYDMVAIFEILKESDFINYKFVNYFYGVSENLEELKALAKPYIDDYFIQCQLFEMVQNLKKAWAEFHDSEYKSDLERLEDAQYDLLEFINKNY